MKCKYCKDTGKYKQPKNQEEYEELIDREMDKGYFVNAEIAAERALKVVGFDIIKCPYCDKGK